MGGVPLDEITWKTILEECDINKDGKVSHFFLLYLIIKNKISNDEFLQLLVKKFD